MGVLEIVRSRCHVAPRRARSRRGRAPRTSAAGLTLLEVLFAMSLLSIGLLAIASAFPVALSGVAQGNQQTTALFLAEQRAEEIKATAFANITSANFPAEGYGTIANAPGYRRAVTITNSPGGIASTVRVDVNVFYRPVLSMGVLAAERQITVSTLVADR